MLPETIAEYRKYSGMSVEELAEGAGLTPAEIEDIEAGRFANYTYDNVMAIADALDCPLYILAGIPIHGRGTYTLEDVIYQENEKAKVNEAPE